MSAISQNRERRVGWKRNINGHKTPKFFSPVKKHLSGKAVNLSKRVYQCDARGVVTLVSQQ